MSFQPIIAGSGMVAWSFLQRTMQTQTAAFQAAPAMQRDTEYFATHIGEIDTAEQLVSDRRLLRVALGAFGLDDDIDNRAFVQKILEDGTLSTDALANKLTDTRYRELSKAFGFGDLGTPATKVSDFADTIVSAYQTRQFELAVGAQDNAMRLALNADRALAELAEGSAGADTRWFSVMGNAPLRSVFETALGLPSSFGQLDLDQQLEVFRERLEAMTGDGEVAQFASAEAREALVQRFLLMDQIAGTTSFSPAQIALTLLQN